MVGTSYLDHRGEQLVLELFDNPTHKARVTAFSNEAVLQTLTLEDYVVQEIFLRIKQGITDAAITLLFMFCLSVIHFFIILVGIKFYNY
jgi:hypothetical protein